MASSPEYLEADNARRAMWIIRTAIVRLTELDVVTAAQMAWAAWQELYGPDEDGNRKPASERLRLLRAVGARLRRLTQVGLTARERTALQQLATLTFDGSQATFGFGLGQPGPAWTDWTDWTDDDPGRSERPGPGDDVRLQPRG